MTTSYKVHTNASTSESKTRPYIGEERPFRREMVSCDAARVLQDERRGWWPFEVAATMAWGR